MLSAKSPEDRSTDSLSKLIFELSKLPGIGEKTATRLAYHILRQDSAYASSLAEAVLHARQRTGLCAACFTFTDAETCKICNNPRRDAHVICVVERPSDVAPIENAGAHRGRYHVLHGAISPLDGIGPEDLKVRELLERARVLTARSESGAAPEASASVAEVILALNPSVEGETTALYLARLLKPLGIRTTRLAYGLPVGGTLEFTDRETLHRALENRVEIR